MLVAGFWFHLLLNVLLQNDGVFAKIVCYEEAEEVANSRKLNWEGDVAVRKMLWIGMDDATSALNTTALVDIHECPFVVSVHVLGKFQCVGALYSFRTVITTANCLQMFYNYRFYHEHKIDVVVRFLSNFTTGIAVPAMEIFFHPNYDPDNLDYNVALLRLKYDIYPVNGFPKTVKIRERRNPVPINTWIWFYGWGSERNFEAVPGNKSTFGARTLVRHGLRVYPQHECGQIYSDYPPKLAHLSWRQLRYVTDRMFCAGDNITTDDGDGALDRDAGAPAIYGDELYGLVSHRWPSCNVRYDAPTVFVHIGTVHIWIKSIDENLPSYKTGTIQPDKSRCEDFLDGRDCTSRKKRENKENLPSEIETKNNDIKIETNVTKIHSGKKHKHKEHKAKSAKGHKKIKKPHKNESIGHGNAIELTKNETQKTKRNEGGGKADPEKQLLVNADNGIEENGVIKTWNGVLAPVDQLSSGIVKGDENIFNTFRSNKIGLYPSRYRNLLMQRLKRDVSAVSGVTNAARTNEPLSLNKRTTTKVMTEKMQESVTQIKVPSGEKANNSIAVSQKATATVPKILQKVNSNPKDDENVNKGNEIKPESAEAKPQMQYEKEVNMYDMEEKLDGSEIEDPRNLVERDDADDSKPKSKSSENESINEMKTLAVEVAKAEPVEAAPQNNVIKPLKKENKKENKPVKLQGNHSRVKTNSIKDHFDSYVKLNLESKDKNEMKYEDIDETKRRLAESQKEKEIIHQIRDIVHKEEEQVIKNKYGVRPIDHQPSLVTDKVVIMDEPNEERNKLEFIGQSGDIKYKVGAGVKNVSKKTNTGNTNTTDSRDIKLKTSTQVPSKVN